MNTAKKFFALGMVMLGSVFLYAQKVTVSSGSERVNGKNCNGFTTELTGSLEEVNISLTKYLKTLGKVKVTGNQFQVSDVQTKLVKHDRPLFATTKTKGNNVQVWMGVPVIDDSIRSLEREVESLVREFGIKFYRDKIQLDIDESVRAQTAAEKQQQRLLNENKSLTSQLEFNRKEKIRLEKLLATNKLDSARFVNSLAKNKKSQDSVAIATDQIKKMVDTHKERQKKVN